MYDRMVKLMMLGLVFCFAGHVSAAMITWEEPFNTTGPEDVLTVGTLHEAINASSAAGEVVINGVTFTNSNDLLPRNAPTGMLAGATTGDADYDAFLDTLDWGGGVTPTLTLGGGTLVPGANYRIQAWFTDLRNDTKKASLLALADEFGNSVTIHAGAGEFGQYAVGAFIADGTGNQTLVLNATNFGNAHFTGYQIRKDGARTQAADPIPSNGAQDIPRDGLILEWTAGDFAASHDVYFGLSFEDVNVATHDSPEFKVNQAGTAYALDRLELGQTYYWRVDEVNDTEPNSPWKGSVWSFEVEPVGILVEELMASASSQNSADEDPNNTINGAGLNPDGSHSQDKTTMWLSAISDPNTAWIRYDLSAPQKLVEMLVWNHNTQSEEDLGFGVKDALIEVSVDGNDFTSLGTVELAQAAETTVALQGIVAQSVKITAQSNWGGIFDKFGLSEVRLLAMPMVALELSPADGAADVDPKTAVLTWRAGREVDVHNVYLSTDEQAVIDGTAPVLTLPEALYAPDLALDTTNYWRVDEVNDLEDPNVWVGSVQSFSTTAYIVVDDMESYSVYVGEEFFATWEDGYDKPANGALVGHGFYAEPETQIVHDGAQSMPLYYGEDGASVSETTRPFAPAEDWSKYGIQSLSLYFYGSADNTGGQLYVKINNGTPYNYQGAATDIQTAQWFPFTIDLTGVTVVNSLTIGVTGGSGMVIIDDIRLYSQASELITPVAPDAVNLQVNYLFEGNFNDSSGNGYDGTATGDPAFVTDPERGQVLSFDGTDDDVSVPLVSVSDEVTIAMWMSIPNLDDYKSAFMSNGWEPNAMHTRLSAGKVDMGVNGVGNVSGVSVVDVSEWVHVAFTVKHTAIESTAMVYLNGIAEGSVTIAVDPEVGPRTVWVGNGKIGAWMNAAGTMVRYMTGMVDDVVIYDRALSAAEIAGLAGRSAPLYKPL